MQTVGTEPANKGSGTASQLIVMKLRDSSTETMVPLLTSDYRTAAAITDGSANGISFPTVFRSSLRFWYT